MIDALSMSPILHFNPRAPRGARLRIIGNLMDIYRFQSTCPARGTTIRRNAKIISKDFNPRAPRGARHSRCRSYGVWRYFNPRAPRGARQTSSNIVTIKLEFQSTCPARGTTPEISRLIVRQQFQSTCPARGTTDDGNAQLRWLDISIHVPREGHDALNDEIRATAVNFNPRAPRGARPVVLGAVT